MDPSLFDCVAFVQRLRPVPAAISVVLGALLSACLGATFLALASVFILLEPRAWQFATWLELAATAALALCAGIHLTTSLYKAISTARQ